MGALHVVRGCASGPGKARLFLRVAAVLLAAKKPEHGRSENGRCFAKALVQLARVEEAF